MAYNFYKTNKYKNKKTPVILTEPTIYNGKRITGKIMLASIHEAERFFELKMLLRAGRIFNLRLQEPYTLIDKSAYGVKIKYVADFVYEENGKTIVEDAKGVRTDVYRLKKRLLAERYGIIIRET